MGHNARKLTQVNKAHKDKSKSNGKVKKTNIIKKKAADLSKELRVLKAQQHRQHSVKSNIESDYFKRGNNNSAPLLCGIFPLFEFSDIDVIFSLLKSTDPEAKIKKVEHVGNYVQLNAENFIMNSKKFKKNFAFTCCRNFRDRFDYLDLAKIVDWCLFILPNDLDEMIGDYTEDLMSSLISQGMPSSCFIRLSNAKDFKLKDEVKYFESITKISLGEQRIQCLSDQNDANKLMRHLAQNCKPSYIASKKSTICSKSIHKKRGYFLAQQMAYDANESELKITGCMRGFGMDFDTTKYIHLTEIGDFKVKSVQWLSAEESNRLESLSEAKNVRRCEISHDQEEMKGGGDEEGSEEDEEEDSDDSDDGDDDSDMGDCDDEEENVSDIGSEDSEGGMNDDKMSFATTAHSGFSVAQIAKFKQSREDALYPDEVDCPINENARDKFRKYRGLKSFKTAEWPLKEHLPSCYDNLHRFKRYQHDRNRLCNEITKLQRDQIDNFVMPGSIVELVVSGVSAATNSLIETILASWHGQRHLVASNLFVAEQNVSVLHLNERRLASIDDSAVATVAKLASAEGGSDSAMGLGQEAGTRWDQLAGEGVVVRPSAEPVESKETALFQVGFRRFASTPIYSEFTATSDLPGNRGKGKYCRFMELKRDVVATVYGPVTYGPVPVLQFRVRQREDDDGLGRPYVAELVATGSLLSLDPTRPIIKRILLSGQIYKVHKRSVMVRYMFFNTDDIEMYKAVPLHTRSNKAGRIIGPHGSHGYMRCHFDKAVTQDELALLPLYKRVFPKYTVDRMYEHLPTVDQLEREDDAEMEAMDALF